MTAKPVIIDTYCPDCKKEHATAIPLDDLKIAVGSIHQEKEEKPDIEAIIDRKLEKLKPPVVEEKPKSSEIKLQSHVPGYRCGPDCQKLHKNKEYKTRPKGKCNNCSQFSNVEKGACPWCENGEIEKVDEDELDDLEIRRPEVHDHDE